LEFLPPVDRSLIGRNVVASLIANTEVATFVDVALRAEFGQVLLNRLGDMDRTTRRCFYAKVEGPCGLAAGLSRRPRNVYTNSVSSDDGRPVRNMSEDKPERSGGIAQAVVLIDVWQDINR
jgi:hypothetical protein